MSQTHLAGLLLVMVQPGRPLHQDILRAISRSPSSSSSSSSSSGGAVTADICTRQLLPQQHAKLQFADAAVAGPELTARPCAAPVGHCLTPLCRPNSQAKHITAAVSTAAATAAGAAAAAAAVIHMKAVEVHGDGCTAGVPGSTIPTGYGSCGQRMQEAHVMVERRDWLCLCRIARSAVTQFKEIKAVRASS